jgi:hypothetical protein
MSITTVAIKIAGVGGRDDEKPGSFKALLLQLFPFLSFHDPITEKVLG